jgi:hypothetical protein
VVNKDRTNRGNAAAAGWLVPRLALQLDLRAVGSSVPGDQTMAMSAVEGKKAQRVPKAGKATAAKAPKVKVAKIASGGPAPSSEPQPTKDKAKKEPSTGSGDRRQLWRVLAFVMLGLAAVLLLWAGLDLGHGWSPDGAKGILLRLTPIVCFLLAAAGAITKASVSEHAKRMVEPPAGEFIPGTTTHDDDADASAGAYFGEQSATSSILGSGYAPAAPLAQADPRPPQVNPGQFDKAATNPGQANPGQFNPSQPNPSQGQFNPAPGQFNSGPAQFNQQPFNQPQFDQAPPPVPVVPDPYAGANRSVPPTLQPGVAVPDYVSSNSQPDYSGQPPTFDSGFAPAPRVPVAPSDELASVVRGAPDTRERHPVGAADHAVIEIYRNWVLTQTTGERAFQSLDVHDRYDEWFLLSASGVATLLAWTHEDHGATYSAETWVDQILPMQGIGVADRQLALDLLNAAALHAGGLHTAPTQRLMAYEPNELVTAMATVHVGLLRLYSGLEGTDPSRVLREQLGEPVDTQPSLPASPPSDPQARWLPPGS